MKKYQDDQTMEDNDGSGGTDGLPQLCDCGQLFETADGKRSIKSGKLICTGCHVDEKVAEESRSFNEYTDWLLTDPDLITDKTF